MRPILSDKDTIKTEHVNDNHIVVAIIEGEPCILNIKEKSGMLNLILSNVPLRSPRQSILSAYNAIHHNRQIVEYALRQNHPVAVFAPSDWKQALQWLIDNA